MGLSATGRDLSFSLNVQSDLKLVHHMKLPQQITTSPCWGSTEEERPWMAESLLNVTSCCHYKNLPNKTTCMKYNCTSLCNIVKEQITKTWFNETLV